MAASVRVQGDDLDTDTKRRSICTGLPPNRRRRPLPASQGNTRCATCCAKDCETGGKALAINSPDRSGWDSNPRRRLLERLDPTSNFATFRTDLPLRSPRRHPARICHALPPGSLVVSALRMSALCQKRSFDRTAWLTGMAVNGPPVIRHTDQAARSLCPTSLTRNGGSSYPEEPWMEIL
jgi:hypothetical protein